MQLRNNTNKPKEVASSAETTSFLMTNVFFLNYSKLATLVNPGTLINLIFLPCKSIS